LRYIWTFMSSLTWFYIEDRYGFESSLNWDELWVFVKIIELCETDLIWMIVWGRHGNGAGWGRVLPSPSPYPILIYLPATLPIPNGDEKLNPIPVPDGFGYPDPIPCNALFYLFNYLIEFRVFLNNLFNLWWCVLFLCYMLVF